MRALHTQIALQGYVILFVSHHAARTNTCLEEPAPRALLVQLEPLGMTLREETLCARASRTTTSPVEPALRVVLGMLDPPEMTLREETPRANKNDSNPRVKPPFNPPLMRARMGTPGLQVSKPDQSAGRARTER